MLRTNEDEMEVRLSPWDPTKPDQMVVKWTDRGWEYFIKHGFPDEARPFLDEYSSLMFLDFKDRVQFASSREVKRQWHIIINSSRNIVKTLTSMLAIAHEGEYDISKIQAARDANKELLNYAIRMKSINYPRANRNPIYDYADRLNICALECGFQLTRVSKWNCFLEEVYRMHVRPLVDYLVNVEKIDVTTAKSQANLLKHVHPETIIKKINSMKNK